MLKATISFDMSVRPSAYKNSSFTGRIFMKFCVYVCIENMSGKLKFH